MMIVTVMMKVILIMITTAVINWHGENSLKVTMEAQLGLIGGTMGLLTGFSILRFLHQYDHVMTKIKMSE